jgi:raffinose/stachyose/melibiose transport system substrate-binding protein
MQMKRIALLVVLMMVLSSVDACTETSTPADGAASSEQIEISVLNYTDLSAPNAMESIEFVWGQFDAAHPEIKVTRQDEFNEPFHNAISAYSATGTLPDVMFVWPSGRSTTLHEQKLLKDLRPLMERDGLIDKYVPLATDVTQQFGGYQAMIPHGSTSTNMFMINREVLDAVGLEPAKTYSELVAQVPILAEAGYECVLMANVDTWVMQSCLFSLVAGRFCGEGWEKKILDGTAKFTDPDFVAALDFVEQMYEDGVINRSTLAVGYGDAPGQFATNGAAYYIDGDWRVGMFITSAETGEALISPERQEASFDITVFPEIDVPGVKFNRSNSSVLGTGYAINANLADGSPELEAAWTLVKWLCGPEVQTNMLRTGGLPTPSWIDIDYSSLDLEPLQIKMANLGNEFDRATVVIDGALNEAVYVPLNDGLQAIGMGTQTPEDVAQMTQDAFDVWNATQE